MKYLVILAITLAVAAAQYYQPEEYVEYPAWYTGEDLQRHRRDVTLDRKVGDGKIFGTLGQNDNGLFGKAGYERNIFDDHRGKLDAQLHGTRVLSPYGDSSHLGGSLNWKNPNAAASLDVNRHIHGGTSLDAAAGGRWPIGKNGDLSAQGFYSRSPGLGQDYGGRLNYNHRW